MQPNILSGVLNIYTTTVLIALVQTARAMFAEIARINGRNSRALVRLRQHWIGLRGEHAGNPFENPSCCEVESLRQDGSDGNEEVPVYGQPDHGRA